MDDNLYLHKEACRWCLSLSLLSRTGYHRSSWSVQKALPLQKLIRVMWEFIIFHWIYRV